MSNKSFRFSRENLFYLLFLNKIIFNNRGGFFAEIKVEKCLRVYFIGYETSKFIEEDL